MREDYNYDAENLDKTSVGDSKGTNSDYNYIKLIKEKLSDQEV